MTSFVSFVVACFVSFVVAFLGCLNACLIKERVSTWLANEKERAQLINKKARAQRMKNILTEQALVACNNHWIANKKSNLLRITDLEAQVKTYKRMLVLLTEKNNNAYDSMKTRFSLQSANRNLELKRVNDLLAASRNMEVKLEEDIRKAWYLYE